MSYLSFAAFLFARGFSAAAFGGFLFGGQLFAFGFGHVVQLFFAHRFDHAFGSAFQGRLAAFAALGGERRAGGHLLFFGFCRHVLRISG